MHQQEISEDPETSMKELHVRFKCTADKWAPKEVTIQTMDISLPNRLAKKEEVEQGATAVRGR